MRTVLEKVHEADVVIVGSPVYYSYPTGQVRSFLEQWLFPVGTYVWENGEQKTIRDKVIPTGMIYTMNCPEDMIKDWNYPAILEDTTNTMKQIMGHNELLYICNTYQFSDYSRYDVAEGIEPMKAKYRDEHFPEDLKRAYEMGKRLAEKAGGK